MFLFLFGERGQPWCSAITAPCSENRFIKSLPTSLLVKGGITSPFGKAEAEGGPLASDPLVRGSRGIFIAPEAEGDPLASGPLASVTHRHKESLYQTPLVYPPHSPGSPWSLAMVWGMTGRITSSPSRTALGLPGRLQIRVLPRTPQTAREIMA